MVAQELGGPPCIHSADPVPSTGHSLALRELALKWVDVIEEDKYVQMLHIKRYKSS